jgi:molybdenum cofactor cytidylyltransferase
MNSTNKLAIIVLAAGASTRMGSPKQLIQWHEQTLLQHCLHQAERSIAGQVYLVLGAYYDTIIQQIKTEATILFNKDWQAGIAGSIGLAVNEAQKNNMEAVLIMLADQPYVSASYLNKMIHSSLQSANPISATIYGELVGVPALYKKHIFSELLQLSGNNGAQAILLNNLQRVEKIEAHFPLIDLDTPEDYEKAKDNL